MDSIDGAVLTDEEHTTGVPVGGTHDPLSMVGDSSYTTPALFRPEIPSEAITVVPRRLQPAAPSDQMRGLMMESNNLREAVIAAQEAVGRARAGGIPPTPSMLTRSARAEREWSDNEQEIADLGAAERAVIAERLMATDRTNGPSEFATRVSFPALGETSRLSVQQPHQDGQLAARVRAERDLEKRTRDATEAALREQVSEEYRLRMRLEEKAARQTQKDDEMYERGARERAQFEQTVAFERARNAELVNRMKAETENEMRALRDELHRVSELSRSFPFHDEARSRRPEGAQPIPLGGFPPPPGGPVPSHARDDPRGQRSSGVTFLVDDGSRNSLPAVPSFLFSPGDSGSRGQEVTPQQRPVSLGSLSPAPNPTPGFPMPGRPPPRPDGSFNMGPQANHFPPSMSLTYSPTNDSRLYSEILDRQFMTEAEAAAGYDFRKAGQGLPEVGNREYRWTFTGTFSAPGGPYSAARAEKFLAHFASFQVAVLARNHSHLLLTERLWINRFSSTFTEAAASFVELYRRMPQVHEAFQCHFVTFMRYCMNELVGKNHLVRVLNLLRITHYSHVKPASTSPAHQLEFIIRVQEQVAQANALLIYFENETPLSDQDIVRLVNSGMTEDILVSVETMHRGGQGLNALLRGPATISSADLMYACRYYLFQQILEAEGVARAGQNQFNNRRRPHFPPALRVNALGNSSQGDADAEAARVELDRDNAPVLCLSWILENLGQEEGYLGIDYGNSSESELLINQIQDVLCYEMDPGAPREELWGEYVLNEEDGPYQGCICALVDSRGNTRILTCWNCNRPGHTARDCEEEQSVPPLKFRPLRVDGVARPPPSASPPPPRVAFSAKGGGRGRGGGKGKGGKNSS